MEYDGDLTGLPVSNTSRTYPNAAYGHMSDEIRLGYQAGVVSLQSPSYGRLWMSVDHHAGDTVSCTQAEATGAGSRKTQRTATRDGAQNSCKSGSRRFVKSRAPAEKRLADPASKLEAVQCAKEKVSAKLREETKPNASQFLNVAGTPRESRRNRPQKTGKDAHSAERSLENEKVLRQRLRTV